jgi:hypothetical protein
LSRLASVPDEVLAVAPAQLEELAGQIKPAIPVAATRAASTARAWTEVDVASFLARGNIEATGPDPHNGALRWKLKACPFNPDHGPGESAVFLCSDGRLGFECRHNSCQDRHWRDQRTLVDGERPAGGMRARDPVESPRASVVHGSTWVAPSPLPEGLPAVPPFDFEHTQGPEEGPPG